MILILYSMYFHGGTMPGRHNKPSKRLNLRKHCPQNNGNVSTNYTHYPIFFYLHRRSFGREAVRNSTFPWKNWPQVFFKQETPVRFYYSVNGFLHGFNLFVCSFSIQFVMFVLFCFKIFFEILDFNLFYFQLYSTYFVHRYSDITCNKPLCNN